jgi:ATP-dependent Lhr-like helicase
MSTVFHKLHPRIQDGLRQLGIAGPTPPQERAFDPIITGENVLLVAPTASGKTEAALLPVFDSYLRSERREGVSIIYITPLRALNRDINKRLIFWGEHLGIDIQIRHGDTAQRERRRQSVKPPGMLITTPETLQAILPTKVMRRHLSAARWVIIDEIHDLAASKRGAQLTIGLERLEEVTGQPFQRIGLSATVGNPEVVASFIGGTHHVRVVEVKVDKSYTYKVEYPEPREEDFDLSDELNTSPQVASRLRRIRDLVRSHGSTLIFVQGRGQAESLGYKLGKLDLGIEVHHGSLSRQQRQRVEDEFKAGELKAIVCTSTLQLGIDIGKVDLCVQYQSPRQVSTLIQRVGRAGHTLDRPSEGVLISAYGEDALESIVTAERARNGVLEPTEPHVKPLDVLTHQMVGMTLDEDGPSLDRVYDLLRRAYPARELSREEFSELVDFLIKIGLVKKEEGLLKRTGKGNRYYYENLGMINDERRYPFINAVTDEVIGTVGDEFWSLRARLGLNVILRGRVWRIIQIDEERGVLHVLPSDDPLGALPGWDGELIPVPRGVAEDVGSLRERIAKEVLGEQDKEGAIRRVAGELQTDESSVRAAAAEAEAHVAQGFPLPTRNRFLLEAYEKYLVIHCTYGENANRTLGAILDPLLSDSDLIYGWWNDSYRILVEAPQKFNKFDLEKVEELLRSLTKEEAERRLNEFMEARFPFGYKMKFIAERFGVIPRGKVMSAEGLENLYHRFKDTPIYRETLREAYREKLDLEAVKAIVSGINSGEIEVTTRLVKSPSPLAKHILEAYADIEELMVSTTVQDQLEYMKKSVMSRSVDLACVNCGEWSQHLRIRELDEKPMCGNCGSQLLAVLRRHQRPESFLALVRRWKAGEELTGDDMDVLTHGRKTADMVLSYGRRAVEALAVHGVGPVTSYQVLSKMHRDEKEFYSDLLKAKIQYMRTRQYWDEK